MPESMIRARSALFTINADERDVWVRMGMAVKSEFDEEGFALWEEWSAQSESHNARDCRSSWKSIAPTGGVNIGTLFFEAQRSGWAEKTKYEKPTAAEIAERHNARAERDAVAAAVEAVVNAAAAQLAAKKWDAALPADAGHPYLQRKGVQPYGLGVGTWEYVDLATGDVFTVQNCLLIPIRDMTIKVHSLQCIEPTPGKLKRYLKGGAKKGHFFSIGKPVMHACKPVFILVEGYATGASVYEATGHMVLVCFDASNLMPVALVVREHQPDAIILMAADNDIWTEGNPGLKAAHKAADAVNGLVAVPPFTLKDQTGVKNKDLPCGPSDFNDWHTQHGAASVADLISQALAQPVAVTSTANNELPKRRCIMVVPGEMGQVVDAGELALVEQRKDLYQYAGQIVRPVRAKRVEAAHAPKAPATRLHSLNKHGLVEELTRAADWEKQDRRRRADCEIVQMDCPMNVAQTLLARGQWRLRVLTAIIDAPTLRADGSVLEVPGYDDQTGLLLEPSAQFVGVPQMPTRADALAALERVDKLVSAFKFAGEADRAVWLAALLTACIRRSLPTAPMFAFSAPTAGSGKSLLVDVITVIVNGSRAPVFSQGRDEAEMEKRLGGALLAGHGMVSIDNCTLPLDGDLLCQALTQQTLTIRQLGTSTARIVSTSATFFATGNNLLIAGDMTRRVLQCCLDPGVERPELRHFDFNPVDKAQAGRAAYLVDVLTILRAYHVAGRPKQPGVRLGSFEVWSDWVRSALLWLGIEDPIRAMERTRIADPKLAVLRAVLTQWHAVLGSKPMLAREAIAAAQQSNSYSSQVRTDFYEALLSVAGKDGAIDSRSLGRYLSSSKDRIVDGMRLVHVEQDRDGSTKWSVDKK